jgi:hypothetical protein
VVWQEVMQENDIGLSFLGSAEIAAGAEESVGDLRSDSVAQPLLVGEEPPQ